MELYVGTSGYSYPQWKGRFYPDQLPANQTLEFYGRQFRTVEINNTFYRMPTVSQLSDWAERVPANFRFAIKAPQQITHILRLKHVERPLAFLMQVTEVLKNRSGPILFQLPPNLKKDLPRLKDFLKLLPPGKQVAMEFRHASWFDEDVLDLLRGHQIALCAADTDDDEKLQMPLVTTADWGYVRLRRSDYPEEDLRSWASRLGETGWAEAFVFFKHEDAARGPQLAKRLLAISPQRDRQVRYWA